MNISLQSKLFEVVGSNHVAYLINEKSDFSVTGYKVMQNHSDAGLLKCAKVNYNGKIKLVYLVGNLKPLSYVASRSGVNELAAVITNLIQRALEINSNGFFLAENLELDPDKIFVDTANQTVHLIYFPISGGFSGKLPGTAFENQFRMELVRLFGAYPAFQAPLFQRLSSELANGSLPLEQILRRLQTGSVGSFAAGAYRSGGRPEDSQGVPPVAPGPWQNPGVPMGNAIPGQQIQSGFSGGVQGSRPVRPAVNADPLIPQPPMNISSVNSQVMFSFRVDVPEFLLGKRPELVNGAITNNPTISRVHCKIQYRNGRYYIMDLDSANGTFLNQQKLVSHQAAELHNGDYIKLSNSEFIVSF